MKVGGIILCGGRSRRMGVAKVYLSCGGEYLLQRMVRIVSEVVDPVVVAARAGQSLPALSPEVHVVYDKIEDGGPLAGLEAGFAALEGRCEAAFVCACDHPLLKPALVHRLIAMLESDAAIVPIYLGKTYSLTAVYRLETRDVLAEQLAQRDLRVEQFVRRCGARRVPAETLADVDPNLESFCNANDPKGFAEAMRALGEG